MLEQEIGSRLREGDLLSRYYEPKNVAKRPKNPKVLVSKSLHEGFATHFFVDRLWFKLETKTARGNYADIYLLIYPSFAKPRSWRPPNTVKKTENHQYCFLFFEPTNRLKPPFFVLADFSSVFRGF
jgi:hypothetical protein